jgi:hypothetical protein
MARKIARKSASKADVLILELKESIDGRIAEMNRNVSAFMEKARKVLSKVEETVVDNHMLIKEYHRFLDQIAHSNQNLEETLLNVLLAIRQNEYLQAWYPAQNGYKEMKVTGPHPAKTKETQEENACW